MSKPFFNRLYTRVPSAEGLPWHRDYPPKFLTEALAEKSAPATALDVGCGAGTYSLFMSKSGYDVTAIDFIEKALDMARDSTTGSGARIQFQQVNVLEYRPDNSFDLVLDSGCLHGFADAERLTYRKNLLKWLAPNGQFVLVHFNKRHVLDWRPVGPRRWRRERVEAFVGADFRLRDYYEEEAETPLPIGPKIKIGTYWFERTA